MTVILESQREVKLRLTSGFEALKGGLQENKQFGSGKAFEKFEFLQENISRFGGFPLIKMVIIYGAPPLPPTSFDLEY